MYAYIDNHFNGRRSYILRCDPSLMMVNGGDYVDLNTLDHENDLHVYFEGVDTVGMERLSNFLDDEFENLKEMTISEYTNALFDIIVSDALLQEVGDK